jgi:2-isopropylmalate synthase
MPQNRVSIFDTTLRDGEQSPGCSMNLTEKVRMANKLQDLGSTSSKPAFRSLRKVTLPPSGLSPPSAGSQSCRALSHRGTGRRRAAEALKYAAHPAIHTFCAPLTSISNTS